LFTAADCKKREAFFKFKMGSWINLKNASAERVETILLILAARFDLFTVTGSKELTE
jgi:hypothetical protein